VRFRLFRFDVQDEPIALQIAFPIATCEINSLEDYFAEIVLEVNGQEMQRERLAREVHPSAGKILVVSGVDQWGGLNSGQTPSIFSMRRPFLTIPAFVTPRDMNELRDRAAGFNGIHLYTQVVNEGLYINNRKVSADEFFAHLDGLGLQLIFIASCDSVQVVRSFRSTDIHALVAATESLWSSYAEKFESRFYHSLGSGNFVSAAFQEASSSCSSLGMGASIQTRSGKYDPMFLDMKSDFCFASGKEN
jgi:hypothetical protein